MAARAASSHVDHVIVHKRGGVNHFHYRGKPPRTIRRWPKQAAAKQQQCRPKTLSAARLQILVDGRDCINRRHRFRTDFALDFTQIRLDEVECLLRGNGLPDLAKHA